jgi:competence ComEA-like helix-hairpin-helix protein
MRVCEAQSLGALMILVASSVVYGGSFLNDRHPLPEKTPLPWGNQGLATIAAQVTGSKGADGIYFLPERTIIAEILKVIGVDEQIKTTGEPFTDGIGYTISVEGGVLKINVMPAITLLALGLPIDLNRASAEELSRVPGIGERLAAQIVELRQVNGKFESMTDLMTVRGIKEKKMNNLKKYLTVRQAP